MKKSLFKRGRGGGSLTKRLNCEIVKLKRAFCALKGIFEKN